MRARGVGTGKIRLGGRKKGQRGLRRSVLGAIAISELNMGRVKMGWETRDDEEQKQG